MTGVLAERLASEDRERDNAVTTKAENGVMQLQAKEFLRLIRSQTLRNGKDSSADCRERDWLCQHLDCDLQPPEV
jgi:hypothetical protein